MPAEDEYNMRPHNKADAAGIHAKTHCTLIVLSTRMENFGAKAIMQILKNTKTIKRCIFDQLKKDKVAGQLIICDTKGPFKWREKGGQSEGQLIICDAKGLFKWREKGRQSEGTGLIICDAKDFLSSGKRMAEG